MLYKTFRSLFEILFEMRLFNQSINFIADFCPHLGSFCYFSHYVSAKFHLWPSSSAEPRPRVGMLSLVTVSPVITAFHSCCLLYHVFDQVTLWPALGRNWNRYNLTNLTWNRWNSTPLSAAPVIRCANNCIYKTKKSNLKRPSGPVAQRIEAFSPL